MWVIRFPHGATEFIKLTIIFPHYLARGVLYRLIFISTTQKDPHISVMNIIIALGAGTGASKNGDDIKSFWYNDMSC